MIEPKLEVPAELRDLAEKTIDQAEKAFGMFLLFPFRHPQSLGDFLFGPLDLGFELVAEFQLVLDEIVEPVADRLFLVERKFHKSGLDFFDAAHGG